MATSSRKFFTEAGDDRKATPNMDAPPLEDPLGGYIFVCNNDTMNEDLKRNLFGLPQRYHDSVRSITPGMPLFLYNYSDHQLHGIFEASSEGGLNIDPLAWENKDVKNGRPTSRFPSQVRVRLRQQRPPLRDPDFRSVLHHYDGPKFRLELNQDQVDRLLALFRSPSDAPAEGSSQGSGGDEGEWEEVKARSKGPRNHSSNSYRSQATKSSTGSSPWRGAGGAIANGNKAGHGGGSSSSGGHDRDRDSYHSRGGGGRDYDDQRHYRGEGVDAPHWRIDPESRAASARSEAQAAGRGEVEGSGARGSVGEGGGGGGSGGRRSRQSRESAGSSGGGRRQQGASANGPTLSTQNLSPSGPKEGREPSSEGVLQQNPRLDEGDLAEPSGEVLSKDSASAHSTIASAGDASNASRAAEGKAARASFAAILRGGAGIRDSDSGSAASADGSENGVPHPGKASSESSASVDADEASGTRTGQDGHPVPFADNTIKEKGPTGQGIYTGGRGDSSGNGRKLKGGQHSKPDSNGFLGHGPSGTLSSGRGEKAPDAWSKKSLTSSRAGTGPGNQGPLSNGVGGGAWHTAGVVAPRSPSAGPGTRNRRSQLQVPQKPVSGSGERSIPDEKPQHEAAAATPAAADLPSSGDSHASCRPQVEEVAALVPPPVRKPAWQGNDAAILRRLAEPVAAPAHASSSAGGSGRDGKEAPFVDAHKPRLAGGHQEPRIVKLQGLGAPSQRQPPFRVAPSSGQVPPSLESNLQFPAVTAGQSTGGAGRNPNVLAGQAKKHGAGAAATEGRSISAGSTGHLQAHQALSAHPPPPPPPSRASLVQSGPNAAPPSSAVAAAPSQVQPPLSASAPSAPPPSGPAAGRNAVTKEDSEPHKQEVGASVTSEPPSAAGSALSAQGVPSQHQPAMPQHPQPPQRAQSMSSLAGLRGDSVRDYRGPPRKSTPPLRQELQLHMQQQQQRGTPPLLLQPLALQLHPLPASAAAAPPFRVSTPPLVSPTLHQRPYQSMFSPPPPQSPRSSWGGRLRVGATTAADQVPNMYRSMPRSQSEVGALTSSPQQQAPFGLYSPLVGLQPILSPSVGYPQFPMPASPLLANVRALHCEVLEYSELVRPSKEARARAECAVESVRGIVKSLWPGADVEVFGSFATGLALPNSDVDVAVVNAPPPPDTPETQAVSGARISAPLIRELAASLQKQDWCEGMYTIETARIPVIKLRCQPKLPPALVAEFEAARASSRAESAAGGEGGEAGAELPGAPLGSLAPLGHVAMDITIAGCRQSALDGTEEGISKEWTAKLEEACAAHNGEAAREFVKEKMHVLPALAPLVLLLKSWLQHRKLNDVYSGGLGSFSLTLMVIFYLERAPVPVGIPSPADPFILDAAGGRLREGVGNFAEEAGRSTRTIGQAPSPGVFQPLSDSGHTSFGKAAQQAPESSVKTVELPESKHGSSVSGATILDAELFKPLPRQATAEGESSLQTVAGANAPGEPSALPELLSQEGSAVSSPSLPVRKEASGGQSDVTEAADIPTATATGAPAGQLENSGASAAVEKAAGSLLLPSKGENAESVILASQSSEPGSSQSADLVHAGGAAAAEEVRVSAHGKPEVGPERSSVAVGTSGVDVRKDDALHSAGPEVVASADVGVQVAEIGSKGPCSTSRIVETEGGSVKRETPGDSLSSSPASATHERQEASASGMSPTEHELGAERGGGNDSMENPSGPIKTPGASLMNEAANGCPGSSKSGAIDESELASSTQQGASDGRKDGPQEQTAAAAVGAEGRQAQSDQAPSVVPPSSSSCATGGASAAAGIDGGAINPSTLQPDAGPETGLLPKDAYAADTPTAAATTETPASAAATASSNKSSGNSEQGSSGAAMVSAGGAGGARWLPPAGPSYLPLHVPRLRSKAIVEDLPSSLLSVPSPNFGILLVGFLQAFGSEMDFARIRLVLKSKGGVLPEGVFRHDPQLQRPTALWIDDPLRPGANIGAGSFAIWHVQAAFKELLISVTRPQQLPPPPPPPPLGAMLPEGAAAAFFANSAARNASGTGTPPPARWRWPLRLLNNAFNSVLVMPIAPPRALP